MRFSISYIFLFFAFFIFNLQASAFFRFDGFEDEIDTAVQKDTLTITGVGDIMMGTNFPSEKYLHPSGCTAFFNEVGDVLLNGDVLVGNLEGCLSDNAKLVKRCKDTTKCYAFRMPRKYANCLKEKGFDFLSIANNHSHDFGREGISHTKGILDSLGIKYAGTPKNSFSLKRQNGKVIGFCAFAPNRGTVSITDYKKAEEIVRYLEDTADIVIVSFHGGAEGSDYRRVTKETEYFYGENRGNVYKFAHHVVDAGADVVFGHGPHVTRAIELYNNRLICYSLGNFITYGRFNLNGPNGIAPVIKTHLSDDGKFLFGEIIPVKQYYSGKVVIDPMKRAIKEISELTRLDFPNVDITISENGIIRKKE
jgi:poly-gamma-glutamate capsule biosynthesis protein CapA/YwtB (metallophosphatase superfamily)